VDEVGRAHLRLPLHTPGGREVAGVDHHDHRVHPHVVGEVRPSEGPQERQGVGEARRLEEEPVEVAAAREPADRVHEVGVPDAAGAALGDLDPGPSGGGRAVDAGEAALVLQDAHPQGGCAGEQPVEERRFPAPRKPATRVTGRGDIHKSLVEEGQCDRSRIDRPESRRL